MNMQLKAMIYLIGFVFTSLIAVSTSTPESTVNLDQYSKDAATRVASKLLNGDGPQSQLLDGDELDVNDLLENDDEKRAQWNKLQGGWGKRADNWNKLSGVWGKRAEKWNQLNGMWGKRNSAKWTQLNGMWGKRGWNDLNGGWGKRATQPHWNNLRGMWGKRSAGPAAMDK